MNLPLNIDFQQIFLHLFNFAILAFGLYILLYKPVKDFLEKRQEHYEAMNAEAEAALEKAKESMKKLGDDIKASMDSNAHHTNSPSGLEEP